MRIRISVICSAFAVLTSPALAQVTTDAGTIDLSRTEGFFDQPGYSPYAGVQDRRHADPRPKAPDRHGDYHGTADGEPSRRHRFKPRWGSVKDPSHI